MDFVWWMKALFLGLFGLAALFLLYIMLIMCVTRRGIVSVLVNYVYLPMIWLLSKTYYPLWKARNRHKFIYVDYVSKTTQVLDYPPAKASAETVRFAVVSDTHTHHRLIDIPPADVLIMCGDLTFLNESAAERLRDLNMWLATLPHKRKIIIGGNHDRILPTLTIETKRDTTFCNGTYLEFSATEVDGIKIYGAPFSMRGRSTNTAYQFLRNSADLQRAVDMLPGDSVDILVTHGPPRVGDYGKLSHGDSMLRNKVDHMKPRFHVFGHIHEAHGVRFEDDIVFINAAMLGRSRLPTHIPIVFDYER